MVATQPNPTPIGLINRKKCEKVSIHNMCWDVEEMGQVGVFIREIPVSSVNQKKK